MLLFAAVPTAQPPRTSHASRGRGLIAGTVQRDTLQRDTVQRDTVQRDTLQRDTLQRDTLQRDTLQRDTLQRDTLQRDTLQRDTALGDSTREGSARDTLHLVPRYEPQRARHEGSPLFPVPRQRGRTASLRPDRSSFWAPRPGSRYQQGLALDSTGQALTVRERIGEEDVAAPLRVGRDAYRSARREGDLRANWLALRREHRQQRAQDEDRLGVSIDVPGGRESAFTTIFGRNEVALDINGQANVDAGFDYRRSDQQAQLTGSPTQLNPDFKQDLRLGITGSIGDKLQVDVNWDTQSQFDYQNQVKLNYTGYEDEIVQSVEAGNVFLDTPSRLIDGGQSLFGIKSEFQLGGLRLTTVASQQEGQSQSLNIEGGTETSEFDFSALRYDNRRHFFLGYYFRNTWEAAHQQPPDLFKFNNFDRVTEIEVWKLQGTRNNDGEGQSAVALVDLGESASLLTLADAYDDPTALPDDENDQYDEPFLNQLRAQGSDTNQLLEGQLGLSGNDFQEGDQEAFRLLEQGTDYTLNADLGYISLQQSLNENQALAVAFRYQTTTGNFQVGDFAGQVGPNERLVLKLLRPVRLAAPSYDDGGAGSADTTGNNNPAAWYLQMRNVYELRGRNLTQDGLDLSLQYNPPGGTARSRLAGLGGQASLLELLGLDRLNTDGAQRPDGQFDFQPGFTIDPGEGLVFFPYLQPFGSRLQAVVDEEAAGNDAQRDSLAGEYVFSQLYTDKPDRLASENSEIGNYRFVVSSQGAQQQSFYDLRAFNGVVEGSVNVTSGGTQLTEGADYQVDYQGGTVTITNETYLQANRNIEIDYEKNALVNLQKKTLLGARADYRFSEDLTVGATLMRLSQRSPADKLRIGQEPIQNTIWGVDAAVELQPRWLTRAVDALPLLQTRAPSVLDVSAEFAQLRPGHSQTQAFQRTQRRLQDNGRNFTTDELEGISYVDDFEGFENSFSLKAQLQNWRISSSPEGTATTSDLRGTMAWYQLNRNIIETLSDAPSYAPELKELVGVNDVFPNRDTRGQANNTLRTFDLYFDPARRGPYNYTRDLAGFLERPEDAWGGITQALPEGQTDFGVKNIEFVEFIFKPYPDGTTPDDAALYLDLGTISEDIIRNGNPNYEDGLSLGTFDTFYSGSGPTTREPTGKGNGAVDIEGNITEDLGLDGLASYAPELYGGGAEQVVFDSFLETLPSGGLGRLGAEVARAEMDPSGDDYHFFEDNAFFENEAFFPGGASFQDRFAFYRPGLELNSYQAQNTLSSYTSGRGNTREPDREDFGFDGVSQSNEYFQYRIPLSAEALGEQARPGTTDDFIVGEIQDESGQGTGWYQARIPVSVPTDQVGAPDLSLIEHMRLWTTGHDTPITLRFATLELVGSQWRKSENITLREGGPEPVLSGGNGTIDGSRLTIASINNEEDSGTYERPGRAVVGQQQLATGGRQNTREQSLVLRVENLKEGDRRAIFKNVQNLNLLKYQGLRLFAHLHSTAGDFNGLTEEMARGNVELFVRLGANETQDYYEYRQPLTPTLGELGGTTPQELWFPLDTTEPDLANEMNLRLTALNQLKVARDRSEATSNEVFWNDTGGVPLDPALSDFAPNGTRIGVKGTPSLQDVSTIVIGLRAADTEAGGAFDDLTLWVNELRATGYDERNGWSATASADVQLADFAGVQASFQRQTDGWGSLSSTLGDRQQNRLFDWSVRADFSLDKLLPVAAGWQIPVTFQVGSRTSTPRFAPNRGDVRLDAILDQVSLDDDPATTETSALRAAQTYSADRSLTVGLQKSGSQSPWLRYTLDNLNLNYSLSQRAARSPSQQIDDSWRWDANLDYQHDFERPHTVRPFWFLEAFPLIGALGELRFNYAPQSIGFRGGLARSRAQSQDRPTRLLASEGATPGGGGLLREPIQDTHSFTHERQFDLQYNPFEFLRLSFNTNTDQSLNRAGREEQFRLVTAGAPDRTFATREAAEDELSTLLEDPDSDLEPGDAFVEDRLDVYGTQSAFQRLFGDEGPRTNDYQQRFTAAFDVPFGDSEALNWIDFEDVAYEVTYRWANGSLQRNVGANASNEVTLRSGIVLHPQNFWRKFGFYRRLEEQQDAAEQSAAPAPPPEDPPPEEDGETEGGEEEEDSAGDDGGEDEEGAGSALSNLPLPNPVGLLRRLALTLTGVRDFSVEYESTRSGESSHVGLPGEGTAGSHTLLSAFRGEGPPLGYRFGFGRRIGTGLRLTGAGGDATEGTQFSLDDRLRDSNRLRARTTLDFSPSLQVNLNWAMDWGVRTNYSNIGADDAEAQTRTRDGSNSASIWAFGSGYRTFFERQLETLQGDLDAGVESADDDGRVVLTNASMSSDFRDAFTLSSGVVGQGGLLLLPLPSWTVSYSGLSEWPLVRAVAQSARLEHGYTAEYASDFNSLDNRPLSSIRLGSNEIDYAPAPYNSRGQSVQERFQPLVGVDVTWKGALQTNLEWNRAHTFRLRPSSQEVVEERTNELRLTASLRKQGLEISFLPFGLGDLNNQITFSLTASRAVNEARDFILNRALSEAIAETDGEPASYDPAQALEGENISVREATTRLQLAPKISYRFSNRISLDLVLNYEHFEGNQRPSYDNIDGGFNVRVSLQE